MSSWIVEDKTINRILTWIDRLSANTITGSSVYKLFKKIGYDLTEKNDYKELDKLGQEMLKMNYKAINARYDSKKRATKYEFKRELVDIVQVLKSLQCFTYQCCEGDVPKMELYIALNRIEEILMSEVISEKTNYNEMEWG